MISSSANFLSAIFHVRQKFITRFTLDSLHCLHCFHMNHPYPTFERFKIEKLRNHLISILCLAQCTYIRGIFGFALISIHRMTQLRWVSENLAGPNLNRFRFSWDARQDWKSRRVFLPLLSSFLFLFWGWNILFAGWLWFAFSSVFFRFSLVKCFGM